MKNKSLKINKESMCSCGLSLFKNCCGRFLSNVELPITAALLMRSRYSAYALEDENYLQSTWHSSTRPTTNIVDKESNIKWLGLNILNADESENSATVEFVARYKIGGRAHRLHEVSRFVCETQNGLLRWFYLDGSFPASEK